jgi:transposase
MTLPTSPALQDLSREELIAIILRLATDVQRLEAEVQRLQAEVDRLKKPPTTSQNSSQPPSRDWKRNATGRKHHRKSGAKPGHAQAQRALVDHPDTMIEARVSTCTACGANLQRVKPVRVLRRQITELPEIKPVVLETQQHEVECPRCHTLQRGGLPEGLEAQRQFGPRLESALTYFHQEQHLGFERLQQTMRDLFGVTLSEGGEVAVLERAGEAVLPEAEAIGAQVRQSAVIGSDETSVRVHGRNWWEWVFVSNAGEYHLIRPSRGFDVVNAFMGDTQAEVWVSDCWKPQLRAPAQTHQVCLPHQIRNLQGLIDKRPHLRWAREMQALFREAVHLDHRRGSLTERGFQRQVRSMEERLDRLLARKLVGQAALTLQARYCTHRHHLFVFLHRPDVPADNNACERALRPSVIHRKVMGSFRSEWGPQAYAALATVLNTAKRKGENVFQKLVSLMGKPILHYLNPSIA